MTRTELIQFTNDYVKANCYHEDDWTPLYHCSADTTEMVTSRGKYIVLRSYATIVAVYSERTATCYEFDRYSATTTQHVRKFANKYGAMRITKLHKDSTRIIEQGLDRYAYTWKPTPDGWKCIIDNDYTQEIESIF